MMRLAAARVGGVVPLVALLLALPFASAAAPAAGDYEARLCVALAAQAPSCGVAQARLSAGRLRLQVNDIAYRIVLPAPRGAARAEVQVMHGTMQIDEFSAPFEWQGHRLTFDDADKATRYDVQLGERRPQAR